MRTPEARLYRNTFDNDMFAVKLVMLKGPDRLSFEIHIDDIKETFGEELYSSAVQLGRGEYMEVLLAGKEDK